MTKVRMHVSAPYVRTESFGTDIEFEVEGVLDIPEEGQLDELSDELREFVREKFFENEPYVGEYELDDDCDHYDWKYEILETDEVEIN